MTANGDEEGDEEEAQEQVREREEVAAESESDPFGQRMIDLARIGLGAAGTSGFRGYFPDQSKRSIRSRMWSYVGSPHSPLRPPPDRRDVDRSFVRAVVSPSGEL